MRRQLKKRWKALHDVVKAGKARYIGASAMYAYQFQKANTLLKKMAGQGLYLCKIT